MANPSPSWRPRPPAANYPQDHPDDVEDVQVIGRYPAPGTLRLPDGRLLAWYEFGDPAGRPCIYFAGTPESGIAGACYHDSAAQAGLKWISVDKPGYGLSDPHPGRRFLTWPADVTVLMDHLGIQQAAVVGESGGGPHALAVAAAIPDRVTVTVLLAAMGPSPGDRARDGMRPTNLMFCWLARYFPPGLRSALRVLRFAVMHRDVLERYLAPRSAAPAVDQQIINDPQYRSRIDAAEDAFRLGVRAAADDLVLCARPWGFSPEQITVPVQLWHGTADVNVPIAIAREMIAALPDVTAHLYEGSGHTIGFERRAEVMDLIRSTESRLPR